MESNVKVFFGDSNHLNVDDDDLTCLGEDKIKAINYCPVGVEWQKAICNTFGWSFEKKNLDQLLLSFNIVYMPGAVQLEMTVLKVMGIAGTGPYHKLSQEINAITRLSKETCFVLSAKTLMFCKIFFARTLMSYQYGVLLATVKM